MKVNFDGSFLLNKQTGGIGLIARNHLGSFEAARIKHIPQICNALISEYLITRESLILAAELDWPRIILEGDSKVLIDILKGKCYAPALVLPLTRDILV
ncbi:hypothetical protein Dimus_029004, partial [Dionaea muscipula]